MIIIQKLGSNMYNIYIYIISICILLLTYDLCFNSVIYPPFDLYCLMDMSINFCFEAGHRK